jgi:hypothetical protein
MSHGIGLLDDDWDVRFFLFHSSLHGRRNREVAWLYYRLFHRNE